MTDLPLGFIKMCQVQGFFELGLVWRCTEVLSQSTQSHAWSLLGSLAAVLKLLGIITFLEKLMNFKKSHKKAHLYTLKKLHWSRWSRALRFCYLEGQQRETSPPTKSVPCVSEGRFKAETIKVSETSGQLSGAYSYHIIGTDGCPLHDFWGHPS